jgi:hypothetical protein
MCADDRIALTRRGFQTFSVEHCDMPVRVPDQSGVLERSGDAADRRTVHAEHHCQKLIAHVSWTSADAPNDGDEALKGLWSAGSHVSGGGRLQESGKSIVLRFIRSATNSSAQIDEVTTDC